MSLKARVKQEPEWEHGSDARKIIAALADEARVKKELITKASRIETESSDELYADHIVKDELVLGPERPHRPIVGLTSRIMTEASRIEEVIGELYADHIKDELVLRPDVALTSVRSRESAAPALRDCFVRLERLNLTPIRSSSKTHHDTSVPSSAKQDKTKKQNRNTCLQQNEKHPYICDTCGKVCKFRHILIQHLRYHLPDTLENLQNSNWVKKSYYCEICKKALSCLGSLKRHLNIHVGKKRHSCKTCGKKFLQANDYKRHKLIHSTDKPQFLCDVCKKVFASSSNLKIHKRNVHLGLKLYSCDICDKKYSTLDVCKRHKMTHSEIMPYICEICNKEFRTIDRLKFHKRIHMTEKPYTCEKCRKGYTTSYEFNKHKLIHLNGPTCVTCNKIFKTSSDLDEHKRINKTPYSCVICKKLFCELHYFKRHKKRMHGGDEKTYYCEMCRRDFKTLEELKSHKQMHKGYSCGECHENFADNVSLQKHKKAHGKKMPYSCETCKMKFIKWLDLFTHQKNTHENI